MLFSHRHRKAISYSFTSSASLASPRTIPHFPKNRIKEPAAPRTQPASPVPFTPHAALSNQEGSRVTPPIPQQWCRNLRHLSKERSKLRHFGFPMAHV